MRPIVLPTIAPIAASATQVCASQSGTANTALLLNGVGAVQPYGVPIAGGGQNQGGLSNPGSGYRQPGNFYQPYVQLDTQRQIVIASVGNDSGITFAITGTSSTGAVISENLTGANAGSATSANTYYTITSIVPSGNTASTVTVGTNGVAGSVPLPVPLGLFAVTLQCVAIGTVSYSITQTDDDPNVSNPDTACVWTPVVSALTNATATQVAAATTIARAYRVTVNSNTPPGGVKVTVVPQQGITSA
jgi:hypothetical protein